ncbi:MULTISPECIES: metallophosphoesterase family protein [Desulfotignum]|jgi:predicted phosphodiesterase|uniref:Metallophosphoesterase n=1 Tax=Desulfotignum phosphitoxidans DSM 13687 TaxID=1286635 RepID=S0G3K2_9BACT|nr:MULTISPECIES: metallophosphoesterase family protein [Desulfotignum]EMS80059.1 metallophosphoesterase [Desulfotignum phosphitoxidans DSM 13687]
MKIAVFSDVHSCYKKMMTVFDDMEKYQIDQYVCLGDIIGYGSQPEETVQLLMSKQVISVRGNHELAMFDPDYLELFPKKIKQPLLENIAAISEKSIQYLEKTPVYLQLENCHFVHGTPPDKMTTYIYDVTDYYLKSIFNNSATRVFFTGHTHKLKLITYKDKIVYRGRINENCIIPVGNNQKYLVNVGSIGFSRDDFEASKYVVYDTENKQIMVRMVST